MAARHVCVALLLVSSATTTASASAAEAKRNGWLAYVTATYPDSGDAQVEGYHLRLTRPGRRPRLVAHGQDPAFSPDGGMLAFTRDDDHDRSAQGIWIARGDGTRRRALTYSDDSLPVWAPGGRKIAFLRDGSSGYRLFVIKPDGTGKRRLAGKAAGTTGIAWSPTGRELAFDGEDGSIFVVGGQGLRRVAATGSEVQWSSRGHLSFRRGGSLIALDAQGTEDTLATGLAIASDVEDDRPYDWSPDGRRVVFSRTSGIFVMNADGTHTRKLTPGGARPRWAPNGRTVFYERPYSGVYGVSVRGGAPRLLVRARRTCDEDCANLIYGGAWQPLLR